MTKIYMYDFKLENFKGEAFTPLLHPEMGSFKKALSSNSIQNHL